MNCGLSPIVTCIDPRQEKIEIFVGDVVHRDGFVFADIVPKST